jgi:hypothetical protein
MTKRAFPVLAALTLATVPMAGQEILGFRSGLSYGGFSSPNFSYGRSGLTIGPTFTISVTRWLSVQTEALYSSNSVGWIEPTVGAATARHFSVPLLARAQFGVPGLRAVQAVLLGGVYSSYMLQCNLAGDLGGCGVDNQASPFTELSRFNYGPTAGVGFDANLFNVMRLGAEVRYQHGVRTFGFMNDPLRSRSWSFGLRFAGPGHAVGSRGYIDAPQQRTLPNERIPSLGPDWRTPNN